MKGYLKGVKKYACWSHANTLHGYGCYPYSVHLEEVVKIANEFIQLIPKEAREMVLASCWCHDLIEDTRQTYNDIQKQAGKFAAEIVFAVTNEKGRNRKERANEKYYEGIRNTEFAVFVKLCDRIANVENAIEHQNQEKLEMYKKENCSFIANLGYTNVDEQHIYEPLFKRLIQTLINN